MNNEEYLGDGVYASFNGSMIELRTQHEGGWVTIYLEREVYGNLRAFGAKMWELKP